MVRLIEEEFKEVNVVNIDLVNQTLLEMQHVLEGALGDSVIRIRGAGQI